MEMFGDRWSLLIVRDLMVRGFRTFGEFQRSGEGIATNILADRLRRLEAAGIISSETEETDARRVNYRLTEKGIDLAPVLLDLLIWGARHEHTGAPCALIANMERNREEVLADVRRRWRERDPAPLLPKFAEAVSTGPRGHPTRLRQVAVLKNANQRSIILTEEKPKRRKTSKAGKENG
jgi:DNA-binding HxlR family transcriptional regulator